MEPRKELKTLIFDNTKEIWASLSFTDEDISINLIEVLSFLTYNVWHKKENFEERSREIIKILEESSPDFICLQEITKPLLEKLLSCHWVRNQYFIPEIQVENDTTFILSKHPCRFFIKQWPTRMNRFLLYCELEVNKMPIAIATIHLESQADGATRKKQLDVTFKELEAYPKAIVLGDFNFDWASENKNISPDYVDVWPLLHPRTSGNTMPRTHDFIAWRPDKVLVKKQRKYMPLAINRVGMEPLPKYQYDGISEIEMTKARELEDFSIKTPSDHFGLNFVLEMLDNTKEEWTYGELRRRREKVYREEKKEDFVWIEGTKRGHEQMLYMEELEKAVAFRKREVKYFEKIGEGIEDILFRLDEMDDLTLIVSVFALHEILYGFKKELKVIQDKFVHEKSFRFRIVVFTTRPNYTKAVELCQRAGFEKYFVFSKFTDVVDTLFNESIVPLD